MGIKSLFQLLDSKFIALVGNTTGSLRWDQHIAHNVDNPVASKSILNGNTSEAVNLDGDKAAEESNINA